MTQGPAERSIERITFQNQMIVQFVSRSTKWRTGRTQHLRKREPMFASFYKLRSEGYAKKLYSVRFWNLDGRVGLQLLVMPDFCPAFTSTPTRRDIRQTYVATFFFSGASAVIAVPTGRANARPITRSS
jgi:hypothetical protein